MHARSGAWRCCDAMGKGEGQECNANYSWQQLYSLLNSESPLIRIVGKQQKIHKSQSLNYCSVAKQRVLFFAMPFLPCKGFALMGHLKTAKCEWLRIRANRHVRICLKQRRTYGSSIYLLLKIKSFWSSYNCQLSTWLHYFLSTSRWHTFRNALPKRRFEICQERMFAKQHRKNVWSIYLLPN